MICIVASVVVLGLLFLGWKLTSRNAYESAEYTVLESDGAIELRQYPDLVMATTKMTAEIEGNDGSFGRLFRYISGDNEGEQKVAMTTPVFMEPKTDQTNGQMSFVLPKNVAEQNAPVPASEQVELTKRIGGNFAVIRFSGRVTSEMREQQQGLLESWLAEQGHTAGSEPEIASYDPPWTPGPLRRNEILIRLQR